MGRNSAQSTANTGARAAALVELVDVVSDLGGDPESLLADEGLRPSDLLDPERIIPATAVGRLILAGAEQTGHAHFGAILATRRDMRSYLGALGRLVWSAPNLGAALREFSKYIEIHITGSAWHLDVEGQLARFRNEFGRMPAKQAVEHNLVLVHRLIKALTSGAWSPSFVYMTTPASRNDTYLRRLFNCPIAADAPFNGIEFHAADLERPLASADRQLSTILHGFVEQRLTGAKHDLVEEVTMLVEKNLISGACSIDAVARFLPYAKSTLQRKLAERGTSYQRILDGVRDRRACDALAYSDISIGQLSDALGYTNIDAFSRAFKKRFGVSPSAWRNARTQSNEHPENDATLA